jgi:hypothetical protein
MHLRTFAWMSRFIFWQRWLFITSILFAIFGVVFAVYGDNPLFRPYTRELARIFFSSDEFPGDAERFRRLAYGSVGACIACCYILLAYIAWYPFQRKEKWAWWVTVFAFGVWAVLDGAVAIRYGVYFQAYIINVFSVIVKALPLAFTWRYFQADNV